MTNASTQPAVGCAAKLRQISGQIDALWKQPVNRPYRQVFPDTVIDPWQTEGMVDFSLTWFR
jgi:hypothetical protein